MGECVNCFLPGTDSCYSNDDCCPPYVCLTDATCGACLNEGENGCSSNADCCDDLLCNIFDGNCVTCLPQDKSASLGCDVENSQAYCSSDDECFCPDTPHCTPISYFGFLAPDVITQDMQSCLPCKAPGETCSDDSECCSLLFEGSNSKCNEAGKCCSLTSNNGASGFTCRSSEDCCDTSDFCDLGASIFVVRDYTLPSYLGICIDSK